MAYIYDSNQVTIVVANIPISEGFAEDTKIEIVPEANAFEDVVGVDGKVTRSKTNDRRATVTLRLMQSSPMNAVLSALHEIDLSADNGAGVGAFMVKDLGGTSLHVASASWIQKSPDVKYGVKATEREWKIRVADLRNFVGGNGTVP